jgi:hypothetical protein
VAGVVTCSIVVPDPTPGVDRTDLAAARETPQARGLISISEDSWPLADGSSGMQALVSIEATNAESIRWYASEILGIDETHPAWEDLERQIAGTAPRRCTRS